MKSPLSPPEGAANSEVEAKASREDNRAATAADAVDGPTTAAGGTNAVDGKVPAAGPTLGLKEMSRIDTLMGHLKTPVPTIGITGVKPFIVQMRLNALGKHSAHHHKIRNIENPRLTLSLPH